MTRGNLTIKVVPDKRGLKPVTLFIEVENIEEVMKSLHQSAPGVQILDLILRVARRR